jgi:predicted nuclease of predicted toxin-antitoxin system
VRLLVDANLAPTIAARLRDADHDAVHVFDIGMHSATDAEIVERALSEGRIVLSSDTDFGAILARRGELKPSLLLLRHRNEIAPADQAQLVIDNLPTLAAELADGAVITFTRASIRVRRLPFNESS